MTRAERWVLGLTATASLMVLLDMLVVTTALSTVREALGASIEALEWTVNAYTLSVAVLLMTAAALGDRFGRRRLLVIGLAVCNVRDRGHRGRVHRERRLRGRRVRGGDRRRRGGDARRGPRRARHARPPPGR
jgi:hypothetical protein